MSRNSERFFIDRLRQDLTAAQKAGKHAELFFVCDVKAMFDLIDREKSSSRPELKAISTGVLHELKCWPEYFEVILSGVKPFEVRSEADRLFHPGDILLIREWNNTSRAYTGRTVGRRVKYVLRNFPGIERGYAILGFSHAGEML